MEHCSLSFTLLFQVVVHFHFPLRSISKHQFLFTFLLKTSPPILGELFFFFISLSHFLPVLFLLFYNPLTNISTLKYFLSKQYLRRHLVFIFPAILFTLVLVVFVFCCLLSFHIIIFCFAISITFYRFYLIPINLALGKKAW